MQRIALSCAAFLFFASCVRADWQSTFSYDVSFAASASGPFMPGATIFSAGSSSPTHIDVVGPSFPFGNDLPNGTHALLGWSDAFGVEKDFGSLPHSPFFIKVAILDKASGLADSIVLGGSFDLGKQNVPFPSFSGNVKRQIGNRIYDVSTLPPEAGYPPLFAPEPAGVVGIGPGGGDPPVQWYFLFEATITSTPVAPTPEPTTIFMAIAGIFGMVVARKTGRVHHKTSSRKGAKAQSWWISEHLLCGFAPLRELLGI
jgi:hypothetical protein